MGSIGSVSNSFLPSPNTPLIPTQARALYPCPSVTICFLSVFWLAFHSLYTNFDSFPAIHSYFSLFLLIFSCSAVVQLCFFQITCPCIMPAAPTQQSQLPSIAWAANNNALVWKLIGLVEEPSNRKVLIGRGRNEVSDLLFNFRHVFSLLHAELKWGKQKQSFQVHC